MRQRRFQFAQYFLMAVLACATTCALAGDLSKLSDFTTGDIAHNMAWISQVGDTNVAMIEQGPLSAGGLDRQYADISQVGNGNQASVRQKGDLNRVRINQDGSDYGLGAHAGVVNVSQNGTGQFAAISRPWPSLSASAYRDV